jgi:hypothetical protein
VLLAKKTDLNYQPVGFPDLCVDFVNSFKASSAANIKLADTYVIDVFPNFQPIVMYIEYHCAQTVNELDGRHHAKVTLPTYIMYCLSIVYGHFLLCDMYVRPTSSLYAMDYFNVPDKKRFTDFLLSLPVPTFLEPILTQMSCTAAPHTHRMSSSAHQPLELLSRHILEDSFVSTCSQVSTTRLRTLTPG